MRVKELLNTQKSITKAIDKIYNEENLDNPQVAGYLLFARDWVEKGCFARAVYNLGRAAQIVNSTALSNKIYEIVIHKFDTLTI